MGNLFCNNGEFVVAENNYGCGAAPIVTSMIKNKLSQYSYTIADIKCFPYHYAKFRLKQHGVEFIDIQPFEMPKLSRKYDIIFLTTVLEHLPDPLEVIKMLYENLNNNGFLIFDYILSKGKGLDTMAAVKQRSVVLDFIKDNFEIVSGILQYESSMGTTVVRKK